MVGAAAQAQDAGVDETDDSDGDYQTVVTGSRSETQRFEAPRSIELVDRERMEELQVRSVPEAVGQTTGVYLQQTNQGAGAPIVRGLIGPQNLILVDGVRFNTSTFRTGPNQYLATFDPFAVRRIEILRGPSSVLYGNGAMGGVLQLLTVEPDLGLLDDNWRGLASLGFSSADAAPGGTLELASKAGDLQLLGGGSFTRFGELRAGGGYDQPLSGYLTGGWRTKAIYSPSSSLDLVGAYFGAVVDEAGRTDKAGQGDVRLYSNTDHLAYVSLRWRPGDVVRRVGLTVSYHQLHEHVDRYNCPTDDDGVVYDLAGCLALRSGVFDRERRYDDVVHSVGGDIDVVVDLFERRLELVTGAELYQDFVGSRLEDGQLWGGQIAFVEAERGNFSDGSTYRTLGLYLHADATVWRINQALGELHVLGGVRFSNFGAWAPQVPEIGDVSYSFNGLVASGGLQWLRPDLFDIYASFAQGFRAPNLQETTVLGDTGSKFEVPNPDLEPERSHTFELGAKLDLAPVEVGAAWFYSMLRDAIDEEPTTWEGAAEVDGAPVVRRINAASGLYTGVEGSLAVELWRFTLAGGITWIEGELEGADGQTHPARRVPPLFGLGSLRYDHTNRRFFTEAYVQWAATQDQLHPSDQQDLRICETARNSGMLEDQCDGTAGWYTLNLRGGYRMNDVAHLGLALLNLTDQRYRTHGSGFDAAGFDARVTLTLEF
ncbi:MAG: TonB-dependent receptor [Deltaproteobacteria bacterium]|nr:TonB-dependent receptor [Deltaproteobacteria bacterium]